MRDMALITLNVASRMFPDGPHASIFKKWFLHHKIIEIPTVEFVGNLIFGDLGENGHIDPGETFEFNVGLLNSGTLDAKNVKGHLSGSDSAHSSDVDRNWGDIPIGSYQEADAPFRITVPDIPCGDKVAFRVNLEFNDNGVLSLPFSLPSGEPIGVYENVEPQVAIPDNRGEGVISQLVTDSKFKVSEAFQVSIKIDHTYIGDLSLTLISPSGKEVKLHARTGGDQDNLHGIYGVDLTPQEPLSALVGEPLEGVWKLLVQDHISLDKGVLKTWGIRDIVGYACE
jgi:subtilisin-like proprotein convertase family protein